MMISKAMLLEALRRYKRKQLRRTLVAMQYRRFVWGIADAD